MTFFVLEKLVLWRHSHDDHECDVHRSTVTLVIVGDAVHTFVDGVVIAAAVLVSLPLGLTTALAVAAHEIPQEAGDFAILLAAGHSRSRALLLNLIVGDRRRPGRRRHAPVRRARPATPCPTSSRSPRAIFSMSPWRISIPTLHRGTMDRNAVRQLALIGLGVATISLL